jgi:hypothetical protein
LRVNRRAGNDAGDERDRDGEAAGHRVRVPDTPPFMSR